MPQTQMHAFVSHSSQDTPFTTQLVAALRAAGVDVWWDEHNLGAGHLLDVIMHEVHERPVFILVLSKAALASKFVREECLFAYRLDQDEPHRTILPVTANKVDTADFRPNWLFLEQFKRIEAAGGMPLPPSEAIQRTLELLGFTDSSRSGGCVVPPGLTAEELTERAESLYNRQEYDCSVRYCRRAIELNPNYASAWYNLAYSLMQPGGHDEDALDACEHVLALKPRHAFAWNLKGYILASLGRYTEQLAACERALELKPNLARNWANKAHALTSLKRYDEALAASEQGLAIAPMDKFALAAKAATLEVMHRYDEALAIYDEIISARLSTRHRTIVVDCWYGKGRVLFKLGHFQEAANALQQSILLDPDAANAWQLLARTLRALGLRREALEAEQRVKALER